MKIILKELGTLSSVVVTGLGICLTFKYSWTLFPFILIGMFLYGLSIVEPEDVENI